MTTAAAGAARRGGEFGDVSIVREELSGMAKPAPTPSPPKAAKSKDGQACADTVAAQGRKIEAHG